MAKSMASMVIALVIVFGGIFYGRHALFSHFAAQYANYTPPPATVSAGEAAAKQWHPVLTAVGSFKSVNGVEVSPEIQGSVVATHFASGEFVEKGQILLELDTAVEQAELHSALAREEMATLDFVRNRDLLRKKAVSHEALDKARMNLQLAKADVQRIKAVLDKKKIIAPFAGKLGIRQVNVGQYVSPGMPLVSLQSMDPLYLEFNVPEQMLGKLRTGQTVKAVVDGQPNIVFKGKVTAINSQVDVKTRNILVQATFDNADHAIYPGMFSDVQVVLPAKDNVVTVPETAITYSLHGDAVFVIRSEKDNKDGKVIHKVVRQYVVVGEHRQGEVEIKEGLKPGEQVVTSGQMKLHTGNAVVINNNIHLS